MSELPKEVPIAELGARRDQPKIAKFNERAGDLDRRQEAGEDVSKEREKLDIERETFYYERDNTGAIVRDRWGGDIVESFREEGERLKELEPNGKIKPKESDERQHVMMVAMAELDRLNDEGGHGGGDASLEKTAANIEAVIEKVMSAKGAGGSVGENASYEVYRYGGNQYAVDLKDMAPEAVAEITGLLRKLSDKERIPASLEKSVKEAPPLVISSLSRKEQVTMMNSIQEKLAGAGLQHYEGGKEMNRAMVDLVAKASDLDMDMAKFANRAERVMEKVARGDADADAFFDKYMKKGLAGSAFSSIESFKSFIGPDGKQTPEFASAVSAEASKSAAQWLALSSAEAADREVMVAQVVAKLHGATLPEVPRAERSGASANRELPEPELEGKKLLDQLKAEASGADGDLAELKLGREKAKRDALTGLEKRRTFYLDLRDRLTPDEEGKIKDTSVVFIDMAFLKYFDKEGGAEVGDAAIKQAAWALEEVQRRMAAKGIEVKAHRYAGDEFTFTVDGDHDAARQLTEELTKVSNEIPPLPRQATSTDAYVDAGLSFNFGVADAKDLMVLERRMREQKLVPPEVDSSPEALAKWRSEMITTMADAGVKEQKALNRFMQLYNKLADEEQFKESLKSQGFSDEQIDNGIKRLVDYSEKALGNKGKDLKRWVGEERIGPEELLKRAQESISEQQQGELKEKRAKMVITDLVIESGVHEARFDREIAAQKRQMAEVEAQYGQEHAKYLAMKDRMTKLETEKADMLKKYLGGIEQPK